MARPLKNNADYFSHDAGMRDDPKIKALRRKYKHTGFSIWCMFLELITDSDNFSLVVDYDIIAGDFDIEPDQLKEIMLYCVGLNLFQFDTDNSILTCKTLEKRFEGLLSKRKRDRHDVIAVDNPQSKVKESKVKERRIEPFVAPEVFESKEIAYEFLSTNFIDVNAQRKIVVHRGWQTVTDNDIKALTYHFIEKTLDLTTKPRDDVRKHFQNWLGKVPVIDLQTIAKEVYEGQRRQRQSAEVRGNGNGV